jgi:hypothetical protein
MPFDSAQGPVVGRMTLKGAYELNPGQRPGKQPTTRTAV